MKKVLISIIALAVVLAMGSSALAGSVLPLNERSRDDLAYPFSFAFIADCRRNDSVEGVNPVFTDMLEDIAQAGPEFLVIGGDLVHAGENEGQYVAFYEFITNWSTSTNIAVFCIPGNHDFDGDLGVATANWQTYIGEKDYYVEFGDCGFVFLNSVQHLGGIQQGLTAEQLSLVESWLSNAPKHRFAFSHMPVWREEGIQSGLPGYTEFAQILTDHNVIACFGGNEHIYRHAEGNGVHYITAGGGGATLRAFDGHEPVYHEPPLRHNDHHWLLVTVDSDGITSVEMHLKDVGHNATAQQYDFTIPGTITPVYYQNYGVDGLYFNGTSDFVDAGNEPSLGMGDEITISMIIKPADLSEKVYQYLVSKWDSGCYRFMIRYDELQFSLHDGETGEVGQIYSTYGLELLDDAWVHIAATYDGEVLRIYKDGVQAIQTCSWAGHFVTTCRLCISYPDNHPAYGPMGFHGWIREISIYDTALTIEEIFGN